MEIVSELPQWGSEFENLRSRGRPSATFENVSRTKPTSTRHRNITYNAYQLFNNRPFQEDW